VRCEARGTSRDSEVESPRRSRRGASACRSLTSRAIRACDPFPSLPGAVVTLPRIDWRRLVVKLQCLLASLPVSTLEDTSSPAQFAKNARDSLDRVLLYRKVKRNVDGKWNIGNGSMAWQISCKVANSYTVAVDNRFVIFRRLRTVPSNL